MASHTLVDDERSLRGIRASVARVRLGSLFGRRLSTLGSRRRERLVTRASPSPALPLLMCASRTQRLFLDGPLPACSSVSRRTFDIKCVAVPSAIRWLVFALAGLVTQQGFAQLAPTGAHYAGRPSDTGYGGTFVNATGTVAATIPIDLQPARGALPIPLQITYGAHGVGAAGLGWDVPLSYIQHDSTLAHRRPASNAGALPNLRERMSLFDDLSVAGRKAFSTADQARRARGRMARKRSAGLARHANRRKPYRKPDTKALLNKNSHRLPAG